MKKSDVYCFSKHNPSYFIPSLFEKEVGRDWLTSKQDNDFRKFFNTGVFLSVRSLHRRRKTPCQESRDNITAQKREVRS
jgi:hypothetical protein